ncbi:MAG: hypothetical protein K0Q73_6523 [Paenibacillus sp.]|nr:hypothetical protein [Paenibacillus sp.]
MEMGVNMDLEADVRAEAKANMEVNNSPAVLSPRELNRALLT